ncbi:MAG: OB-fold domain-containing protein [Myxococcales bacterium]|nr:OB-fold domain-containing protein [Myxococcales bacterium]
MREIIDAQTAAALRQFGDSASEEFYRRLKAQRLCTTRCDQCGEAAFPPRSFCPYCHSRQIHWFELPRRARLYAFTQQGRSLRFIAPEVIGLVDVEGLGRILSRIDAPLEGLRIGQELEVAFQELTPEIWVHHYRPVN